MATDHTPGPWHIVDREIMEDGSVYPCHILGGAADYQVCTLESPQIAKFGAEQPHRFPGLNGVLGPNARLIAAAPELLALLDECQDCIEWCAQECGHHAAAELAERIAALIAKATGEQA